MLYIRNSLQIYQYRQFGNKKRGKICHENINQREAGMPILISLKVDFKAKKITRDRY